MVTYKLITDKSVRPREVCRRIAQRLPSPLIGMVLRRREVVLSEFVKDCRSLVKGGVGVEIGGPSALFGETLGLYRRATQIDGVNFASKTLWEGRNETEEQKSRGAEPRQFRFGRRLILGSQFVAEATDLSSLPDGAYDFILSSNCLEHVANPLKALLEWRRVVRPGSHIVLVLPNPESNFDRHRKVTEWHHILADFMEGVDESDLTHVTEILRDHDIDLDPLAGSIEQFERRSLDNFVHRGLHHHVFSLELIRSMMLYLDVDIIHLSQGRRNFFLLGAFRREM
jgi:SAM-dependent methyltransferase